MGYVSGGSTREIQLGANAPDPKGRIAVLKRLEEAGRLLNAHNNPRATYLMEQALRQDPGNPTVHVYLAMALERTGQLKRAVPVYQDAINLGISTDVINARLGKRYLHLHQPDKAVEAMNRANQINPTDLANLRALGFAQLQLGRVDEAERTFKAITVQNDHCGAAYNGLGLVAIKRGDRDAARRDFEKAFELDPSDLEPLLNLGVFYETSGNKPLALRYYQEFLEKASPKDYGDLIPKVRSAVEELKSGG